MLIPDLHMQLALSTQQTLPPKSPVNNLKGQKTMQLWSKPNCRHAQQRKQQLDSLLVQLQLS